VRHTSRQPSPRSGRRLLALLGAFALLLLGVSALTAPAQAATSITNGGFETGDLSGWTTAGTASVTNSGSHSGTYAAQLGSTSATNGDSSAAQSFTAPSGGGTLAFWYNVTCPDTVTYDWATATLADTTAGTTATVLAKTCVASSGWTQVSASVVSGHNYTLTLVSHDDNYAGDPTSTKYDDVTLTGSAPPPSGITNGGFETGNLSGWTATGASESAVNSGAHSGTYAAQLGSTTATNGDSSIAQTFTVPTGSTQLSFWYNVTCPDTVTYDWATATLADATAGTTSTPLAKTCVASSGWQQVTAAVTAGHSYTLTLTSHDDNYAGDPTSTKYDDVALNGSSSPDFSLADSPASGAVTVGGSTTTSVSVAASGGFTGSVALSASGLPAGTTATFNPTSVSPGGSSTLTLATSSTTPTGASTVTITGTSGTLTHTASYALTVNPVATNDFSLSDSPTSGAATQGTSTTTTVSTAVASGTAQSVALSASGLPTGASATFNPTSVTAGSASTLTLATASSTPTGSYTITVTGTYPGGSPTHTATFTLTVTAAGGGGLQEVSTDPFTDTDAQHSTEVEPDTYAYGNTVVAAFQVGRVYGGGSSDLGWATSTNGGSTWQHGFLNGITVNQGGGTYAQVSDASVAYDPKHNVWMIVGLPVDSSGNAVGVTVNRSTDGGLTWGSASQAVGFDGQGYDKQWVTCDTTSTSPHYGNCYIEADITSSGNAEFMATSTDGGVTWGPITQPAGSPTGLGGQPVVQPNGNVIVPFSTNGTAIDAFTSTNGGTSWGGVNTVSSVTAHTVNGGLRDGEGLPSAEIDASGKVYVAWQDCRFRSGCPGNDIVMSTSTNGTSWSAVTRIPIDATTSGADHMIPGLGVDHATSGSTAKLGLYYYFYPNANCTASTCQMSVGFISSADGGSTWGTAQTLGTPMTMAQIASTSQGSMVGDYISCSVVNGKSVALVAIGKAPTNGQAFDEGMYTVGGGLAVRGGPVRATAGPVFGGTVRSRMGGRHTVLR
jgi:hypothetical protein